MRLNCPFCGARDVQEFVYLGDATVERPAGDSLEAFHDYVFLRDNPAGLHREYWQHLHGCRSWLVVTRDTRTHEVAAVEPAKRSQP
jgi:methylglutamate dehydrogenase subunit B